ncbi:MAG: nitroreductase family protein [Armatimonadota bacterium]|nr:nitroreductase family protein [Armatimonadota bacterium]MDR7438306.1 nitroreductase family protein [Armatimonadota bacterium]MDR7443372.1 nitroreductase family protein [Armatimonadota bacterium]MDR7563894.1 nitroreductase family protein [Armatimonadota bacterium]MDR7567257.1 nitroreductase family protein [Armatimonadota bacterium]
MTEAGETPFWPVLWGRRSVRFYTPDRIPQEVIERLLLAATLAPSAHNTQPWRFVVLQDPRIRRRLVQAMARRWEREMRERGVDEKTIRVEVRFSLERFTKAPLLVMPCLTMEEMDRYPRRHQRRAEHTMAVQSVAAAIQNLLLAAHAMGLGACWCCAPLFCQGLVRRILRLPRTWEPQAFITVGRPRHRPPVPPRKALEEVLWVI